MAEERTKQRRNDDVQNDQSDDVREEDIDGKSDEACACCYFESDLDLCRPKDEPFLKYLNTKLAVETTPVPPHNPKLIMLLERVDQETTSSENVKSSEASYSYFESAHQLMNKSKSRSLSLSTSSIDSEEILREIMKDYELHGPEKGYVIDGETVLPDLDQLPDLLDGLSSNSDFELDDENDLFSWPWMERSESDDGEEEFIYHDVNGIGIDLEELRLKRDQEVTPLYPHRALRYMECHVCLTKSFLRRRVCCDFQVCRKCMSTYIEMRVREAHIEIECPNDRCSVFVYRDEIIDRLSEDMRERYAKFLIDANKDPYKKTCPTCSKPYEIDQSLLTVKKKKLKMGVQVVCPQCKLAWCFICQAPFHEKMSCKQYQKGDEMVRRWAKERGHGQSNAQRCPKCKIFIQKVSGCDHMKCTKCSTDFCYSCGDRYISIKLLGNHWSRFSPVGCKYRFLPKRPGLRRLIRGTNLAARLVAGVVLAGLGVAVGAVLIGASVIILPGYGIFRLKRRMWEAKQRKKFLKQKMLMTLEAEKERALQKYCDIIMNSQGNTSTTNEESEVENPDTQQVQVIVHRDDREDQQAANVFINKYTSDGTDVVVTGASMPDKTTIKIWDTDDVSVEDYEAGIVVEADVKEIQNEGGYPTMVANIVSKICSLQKEAEKDPAPVSLDSDAKDVEKSSCTPLRESNNVEAGKSLSRTDSAAECKESLPEEGETTESGEAANKQDFTQGSAERKKSSESDPKLPLPLEDDEKDEEKALKSKGSYILGDDDEPEGNKDSCNGCFGNIFSKKLPGTLSGTEDAKIQPVSKRLLQHKFATWEKNRSGAVESILKSVPLDCTADIKTLPIIIRRSSSSVSPWEDLGFLDLGRTNTTGNSGSSEGCFLTSVTDEGSSDVKCQSQGFDNVACDCDESSTHCLSSCREKSEESSDFSRGNSLDHNNAGLNPEHSYISQISAVTYL